MLGTDPCRRGKDRVPPTPVGPVGEGCRIASSGRLEHVSERVAGTCGAESGRAAPVPTESCRNPSLSTGAHRLVLPKNRKREVAQERKSSELVVNEVQ